MWRGVPVLIAFLVGVSQSQQMSPAIQSAKVVDRQVYEKVLDAVFRQHEPTNQNVDQFILRFEPSRQPEFLLTIAWHGNDVSVVECKASNGQIWAMLNDMLNRNGVIDTDAVIKSVRIDCRNQLVSRTKADLWRTNFFSALTKTTATMYVKNEEHQSTSRVLATLDGTTYRIRYCGYPADISLTFQDIEVGAEGRSTFQVIDWVRDIHKAVGQVN